MQSFELVVDRIGDLGGRRRWPALYGDGENTGAAAYTDAARGSVRRRSGRRARRRHYVEGSVTNRATVSGTHTELVRSSADRRGADDHLRGRSRTTPASAITTWSACSPQAAAETAGPHGAGAAACTSTTPVAAFGVVKSIRPARPATVTPGETSSTPSRSRTPGRSTTRTATPGELQRRPVGGARRRDYNGDRGHGAARMRNTDANAASATAPRRCPGPTPSRSVRPSRSPTR